MSLLCSPATGKPRFGGRLTLVVMAGLTTMPPKLTTAMLEEGNRSPMALDAPPMNRSTVMVRKAEDPIW